jgi:peroxiredoxin
MPATIGSEAPPFSLPDTEGDRMSLDDLKGSKSLIIFIPFPFTGICEGELCAIRDRLPDLAALDATVVAITCDTRFSNKKWSDENEFGFPVLSDYWPHGEVARAYGVFNEEFGCADRTTLVLDSEGTIRAIVASSGLGEARDHRAYAEALKAV